MSNLFSEQTKKETMMNNLKHLYEYDDDEIRSMMGDLEEVGHGSLKGWLIIMVNLNGQTLVEMLIADDWKKATMIYDKHGNLGGRGVQLASELSKYQTDRNLTSWDIIDGFNAKGYKEGYKKWDMANPYYTTQVLNHFFSNAESIMNNIYTNKIALPPGATEMKLV
jgi:hypothetical protein